MQVNVRAAAKELGMKAIKQASVIEQREKALTQQRKSHRLPLANKEDLRAAAAAVANGWLLHQSTGSFAIVWPILITAQHSMAQHSMAQHSTAQHIMAQHGMAWHGTAPHSFLHVWLTMITAQHSTAQHSTAQHSTAQHSTAQHSTAQQGIALHMSPSHSLGSFETMLLQRT